MNSLNPGVLWLWTALFNLWTPRTFLPRARTFSAVAVLLTGLAASAADAQEPPKIEVPQTQNPYIPVVAALYEEAKYEGALFKIEKALDWDSNGPRELIWLKMMQGVLQAELAQGAVMESFKEALAMDAEAQLPVKDSRRLRRLFEQARGKAGLPTDEEILAVERAPEPGVPEATTRPPPRRQGLSVSVRGEVDVLGLGITPAVVPGVGLGYSQERLGGVVSVLAQSSPGLRAEGQFHPFTLGGVRPYVGLGATAFFQERDAQGTPRFLGGVSARGVLGLNMQWTSRLYAFADVAYERFFTGGVHYGSQSVLLSAGVGLFP